MPLSPTPAQSEASRLNALRSTGPVTEAGKAASSRNAVRHGLRGTTIEVTPEEQDFLVDTTASLERRWKPVDAVEHNLVQALAMMELKLVRLDTIEMQVLAAAIEEPDGKRLVAGHAHPLPQPHPQGALGGRAPAAHRHRPALHERSRGQGLGQGSRRCRAA